MSKKHEEHEEHVNHEAWVIPYADLLTLLMAMFLALWAISTMEMSKFEQLSSGFADAIGTSSPLEGGKGVLDGGNGPDQENPGDAVTTTTVLDAKSAGEAALAREAAAANAKAVEDDRLTEIEAQLSERAKAKGLGDVVRFRREARGLVVTVVSDQVLFDPGQADLRPAGVGLLDAVSEVLGPVPNLISIEGHADSRPISTAKYPSNWELSTARATSVLRYFTSIRGFDPRKVSAAGYGDTRPLADNGNEEGRSTNRRVEIVVLSSEQP